jgi:hypothetical protein
VKWGVNNDAARYSYCGRNIRAFGDFQKYHSKAKLENKDWLSIAQDREKAICPGCRVP